MVWDANGWPIKLQPGASATIRDVVYVLFTEPYGDWGVVPPPTEGEFQVLYEGDGAPVYSYSQYGAGADEWTGIRKTGSCGDHCDRVEIHPFRPGASGESLVMISLPLTEADAPNHLRNIRVIWPGGLCDRDPFTWHHSAATCAGTYESFVDLQNLAEPIIFHPDFLRDLRGYQALRFMDWQQTKEAIVSDSPNGDPDINYQTEWSHRRTPDYATWINGLPLDNLDRRLPARGAPVEVMTALSNVLRADAWLHIPYDASDDYVQQFATLVRNSLSHGQRVYLEYGNEAWNFGWPYIKGGKYLKAKG